MSEDWTVRELQIIVRLMQRIIRGCPERNHRTYKGKRPPRVNCLRCLSIHQAYLSLKEYGTLP